MTESSYFCAFGIKQIKKLYIRSNRWMIQNEDIPTKTDNVPNEIKSNQIIVV